MNVPPMDALDAAIANCAHAMGGARDASLWQAVFGEHRSPTLRRARADRWACRHRYHDRALHERLRPHDAGHSIAFDALEQARTEALGAREFAGVAVNIAALLVTEPPPLLPRAALEQWAGIASITPAERVDVRRLSWHAPLATLCEVLHDQQRFAEIVCHWLKSGVFESRDLVSAAAAAQTLATSADQGAGPAAIEDVFAELAQERAADEASASGSTANTVSSPTEDPYRIFTTAYDAVVDAAKLTALDVSARLWDALTVELAAQRTLIVRLAHRLQRALLAEQQRHWRFDLDAGLLDGRRLARLIANPGQRNCFMEEAPATWRATAVTLLIDHSGSMRGAPIRMAALTTAVLTEALERCGVKVEVLGFTTRTRDGGRALAAWQARGRPARPGRLNEVLHIVHKSANTPWRRARARLGFMLQETVLKENIDGEALAWAHARALARPEPRRALIVISDGAPEDAPTRAANDAGYLPRHLQRVITDIEARSPVQLFAIGIGHDVTRYYRRSVRISNAAELPNALLGELLTILTTAQHASD